jgi:hypothetical protein
MTQLRHQAKAARCIVDPFSPFQFLGTMSPALGWVDMRRRGFIAALGGVVASMAWIMFFDGPHHKHSFY